MTTAAAASAAASPTAATVMELHARIDTLPTPAPLILFSRMVSENSTAALDELEKRIGGEDLSSDDRILISRQITLAVVNLCTAEMGRLRPEQLATVVTVSKITLTMNTATIPITPFDNDQMRLRIEVMRLAWGILPKEAPKTAPQNAAANTPSELTTRPWQSFSLLRGTSCTLLEYDGAGVQAIDFTSGCLTPTAAAKLKLPVLTMKEAWSDLVSSSGPIFLEDQTASIVERGDFAHKIQIAHPPERINALLTPHFPRDLVIVVQQYIGPAVTCTGYLPAEKTTKPWGLDTRFRTHWLFPYSPTPITDASATLPWIKGEIARFHDDGEAPQTTGDWISHDGFWVTALVTLKRGPVIILSHPNMGMALSYTAKEDPLGYCLEQSIEVTIARIKPSDPLADTTSLVTAYTAFSNSSK